MGLRCFQVLGAWGCLGMRVGSLLGYVCALVFTGLGELVSLVSLGFS